MRTSLNPVAPVANVPRADHAELPNPAATLLGLFDHLSIRERWTRMCHGLRQPRDSGEHKWAVVELERWLGAALSAAVPLLLALLLTAWSTAPRVFVDGPPIGVQPPPRPEPLDPVVPPDDPREPPLPEADVEVVGIDIPRPELQPTLTDPNPAPQPTDIRAVNPISPVRVPFVVGGPFVVRGPEGRTGELKKHQAEFTDSAVQRALRWLKTQQESDGAWPQTRPAMTALAALTYLAYGQTTGSREFGPTLERALRYLVEAQEADGRFRGRDGHDYTQPIAAYALAEAFGMLRLPHLKEPAQKAIQLVIDGQNAVGGFNYNLKGAADTRNDTTYTSWCVQALKAARMANLECRGLDACMRRAVDGVRQNFGQRDGYGGFGYTEPGGGGTALSGAGVLCLQFLGDTKSREYREGIVGLDQAVFAWKNLPAGWSHSPLYYGYYITQARFQHGGESWKGWKDQFAPVLVRQQTVTTAADSGYTDADGRACDIGYWDSPSPTEATGGNGRIMDTILCTLMLEVYYRYLPTFGIQDEKARTGAPAGSILSVDVRFRR